MNSDQQLIAWMVVILFLLVVWQVYKGQVKAILFDTPESNSGGFDPWNLLNPLKSPLSPIGGGGLIPIP